VGLATGVLSLAREPVRLTLRVWELGLSSATGAVRHGLELLDPDLGAATVEPYPPPPPRGNGRAPDLADVAPPDVADDAPPAVPDELLPDHVDEEVVLVAEVAEEGAEEGAGPELHIAEPWESYDRMAAVEICDRLTAATPELAAAVELYEAARRSRRSVLDAAGRAIKR
jgi:hypothetical protein